MINILKIISIVAYILFFLYAFNQSLSDFQKYPESRVETPEQLHSPSINQYREKFGYEPFKFSGELFLSASHRAQKIAIGDAPFSHDGYVEHIKKYYKNAKVVGENLARYQDDEEQAIEQWKQSHTHREVLLSKKACHYALGKFQDVYVLHVACR